MRLRARLVVSLALAAAPLVFGLEWVRADLARRGLEQGLVDLVTTIMESGGREECEASPETYPGPGPFRGRFGPPGDRPPGDRPPGDRPPRDGPPPRGPGRRPQGAGMGPGMGPGPDGGRPHMQGQPPRLELHAYGPDLVSRNPSAPPFPPELSGAIAGGRAFASRRFEERGRRGIEVAVRMAWADGPCAVVVARRADPPPAQESDRPLATSVALAAGLLIAALLAAGPIVRRIRRLESEVRRAAAGRYQAPIAEEGSDEVADLARAFNEAGATLREHVAALERREETLRAFVANTTHDVAIPLTVLQGHLATLRARLAEGGPADPAAVQASLEEAHYMASLLHNLGVAAKLEAGEPHVRRDDVDMGRLVERVVMRHRPIAVPRGISLDFAVPEAPLTAKGDVTLLEQAVSNLVHNAVRYNRDGGHVAVVLEGRPGIVPGFTLRVTDDGPGVTADELPRLFERSFRGEAARTRRPDGLGLGLHIASDVARRHGFTLAARRPEAGGLEVELASA